MSGSTWSDLAAFIAIPRLGGLCLSPDGTILLVSVAAPNDDVTEYRSAWWRVDTDGAEPARRWTRSIEGESTAAFTADGSLLFTSKRPAPPGKPGDKDESAKTAVLWCLPAGGGEAYPLARRSGGWSAIAATRTGGRVLLTADAQVSSTTEADHTRVSEEREERKVSAVLHESYPVRFWDHDLGATDVRLLGVDLGASEAEGDLAPEPDAFVDLTPSRGCTSGTVRGLSDDGRFAVLDWTEADPGGVVRGVVGVVEFASGRYDVVARDERDEFSTAVISADGSVVVCTRTTAATPERAPEQTLWLHDRSTGASGPVAEDWDAWPTAHAISPDGGTVYVTVDERGHGPLYAVELTTGTRRRLTGDGAIGSVVLGPDGSSLYATRSSYTDPGSLIAVDTRTGGVRELRSPVSYPALPGRCEDVTATAEDGTEVRGYLLLPQDLVGPAPLALWIHGGPLSSWSSWSWRWCPWLLVARGYAVLLPDPALSTGYGQEFVQRGWGRWGGPPYTDLMAITDSVVARSDIDEHRTVAMGGSFGGYMANWIAGHTDRFLAIVTHASLWNLETFGPTTDAAWYWAQEMSPSMMREHSPHRHAAEIRTPMLVVHGDRDYRVPISEGLALWWALVSGHDGAPETLPHKFLYYPDENHWVLTPQHARVWYETVFAFLDTHVDGLPFRRPPGL